MRPILRVSQVSHAATMSSAYFRTLHARFDASGLRGVFSPRKPRSMVLRILLGLVGVALLAVLLVVGVFVGAAMILFGLLRHLLRRRVPQAQRRGDVIDVEYRVVPEGARHEALR